METKLLKIHLTNSNVIRFYVQLLCIHVFLFVFLFFLFLHSDLNAHIDRFISVEHFLGRILTTLQFALQSDQVHDAILQMHIVHHMDSNVPCPLPLLPLLCTQIVFLSNKRFLLFLIFILSHAFSAGVPCTTLCASTLVLSLRKYFLFFRVSYTNCISSDFFFESNSNSSSTVKSMTLEAEESPTAFLNASLWGGL